MLSEMGQMIYGDIDPSSIMHSDTVYQIDQSEGDYTLRIKLPFVKKDYVDLFKEDGNLVVRIGSFKRHVFLPRALVGRNRDARLWTTTCCHSFSEVSMIRRET